MQQVIKQARQLVTLLAKAIERRSRDEAETAVPIVDLAQLMKLVDEVEDHFNPAPESEPENWSRVSIEDHARWNAILDKARQTKLAPPPELNPLQKSLLATIRSELRKHLKTADNDVKPRELIALLKMLLQFPKPAPDTITWDFSEVHIDELRFLKKVQALLNADHRSAAGWAASIGRTQKVVS